VPTGALEDGDPTGVHSLDPAFDHNPGDEFVPCADNAASDYALTQAQINYLGDELSNQIVEVDEQHFGPMDAADPENPASDSLVTLVYNVQDENYYDCSVTTYTAGYFAPDFVDRYLDDEASDLWNLENFDLGPASRGWTIDVANNQFWDYRGVLPGLAAESEVQQAGQPSRLHRAAVRRVLRDVPQPRAAGEPGLPR
jgi:hypothetical protein